MGRSRPIAALVALALGGTVLTGCSTSPTDAATVDGTSITRSQLQQALDGANQILGAGNQLSDAQVLTVLVQGVVADSVAEQRNLSITDGDRDAKLSAAALAVPSARPFVYDVANESIISERIGETQFRDAIASAKVVVNPRYGAWQPQRSIAVIADNGSLSQVLQSANS